MITAKELYETTKKSDGPSDFLAWLDSLPDEADPLTFNHPDKDAWVCWYANHVLRDRWPEAEPSIMTDANATYNYARKILKKRWVEAEPIILTDPDYACWYAGYVIKGRWVEAEPIIKSDPYLWKHYTAALLDKEEK